jgi:hypothetical protein
MLDEGKLEDKEIFCLLLNFPGKFGRQKLTSLPLIASLESCTSSKIIGTTMDSV